MPCRDPGEERLLQVSRVMTFQAITFLFVKDEYRLVWKSRLPGDPPRFDVYLGSDLVGWVELEEVSYVPTVVTVSSSDLLKPKDKWPVRPTLKITETE